MFGIGALLKSSLGWLTALKWAGGAYLVWLGLQVWRAPPPVVAGRMAEAQQVTARTMFAQGLLSASTNPKGLLFFAAFLPQFIDPQRSMALQFAIMAGTFVGTEVLTEYGLASTAQRLQPWLLRVGRRFNKVCGGLFVLIGAALPLRG